VFVVLLLGRRSARWRSLFLGAALGGIVGYFVMLVFAHDLLTPAYRVAGFLAKMGFPRKVVFPWCNFSALSGVIVTGGAIGAGLGWWMKREPVK